MNDKNTKKLVFSALFAALICVAALALRIPTPLGGYIHAGDAVALLGVFLLGPVYGAAAAAIGSTLCDIICGYALYAPGTLVIKLLASLAAGAIFLAAAKKKEYAPLPFLAAATGELIMTAGYLCYEWLILGYGAAALGNVPMNLIQSVFGIAASVALFAALRKSKYFDI